MRESPLDREKDYDSKLDEFVDGLRAGGWCGILLLYVTWALVVILVALGNPLSEIGESW